MGPLANYASTFSSLLFPENIGRDLSVCPVAVPVVIFFERHTVYTGQRGDIEMGITKVIRDFIQLLMQNFLKLTHIVVR